MRNSGSNPSGPARRPRHRAAIAAGDTGLATTLLEELLADAPHGPPRARLLSRRARLAHFGDDIGASVALLRQALAERKDQIQVVPLGGTRWIAMNTTIPPFNDVDVRRAVTAGFDREAIRLMRQAALLTAAARSHRK